MLALALILVGAAAISLLLGRYPIDPAQAVAMFVSKIVPVDPIWTEQQATLFFNVRLPRILLALMVGCCLACAGAAYQGTFQNPLVSPDILGASQGAAFGAAVAILLGVSSFTTSLFAFGFSLFTVLLVLLISSRARGNHMMVVVLAGVMVSSLFQAGVSYAKLVADPTDELADITYWLMGSLTGANMRDIAMVFPIMLIGCATLFALRWRINILTMGDDEAATMGVNARRTRIVVIVAATLVTAASVCVTGMIGWVGLVHSASVPHARSAPTIAASSPRPCSWAPASCSSWTTSPALPPPPKSPLAFSPLSWARRSFCTSSRGRRSYEHRRSALELLLRKSRDSARPFVLHSRWVPRECARAQRRGQVHPVPLHPGAFPAL